MKRINLFLLLISLLMASEVKGQYTTTDLTDNGWTEVTSLDAASLAENYYVFYSVEGTNLMLAQEVESAHQGNKLTGVYRTAVNPLENTAMVWTIDYTEELDYGIRSLSDPTYYMQSHNNAAHLVQFAYETNQSEWTRWVLAYENSKWTIRNNVPKAINGNLNLYIGPWEPQIFSNGSVVAGNKDGENVGHFKIYQMSKVEYYRRKYYPAFTAVTSTDDLTAANYANNYYIIVAETNPELVVTARNRTDANVRLKYLTQDVLNNTAQLWTMEANDGGFSLRNLKKNHGFLQTYADGAYACAILDINESGELTKFAAVSDGVSGFTIANSYHSNNYWGLWTPTNGYKTGEVMAANKTATAEIGHYYIYSISRDAYKTAYLENNAEVTEFYMTNAHVESAYGWGGENVGTYNKEYYNGAPDNIFLDNSGKVANMAQTVTLPAGDYILKVATRASTTQNYAWIYVLDVAASIDLDKGEFLKKGNTGNTLGNGWNWNFLTFTLDSEKAVQIGFYKQNASWAGADDFHLYKIVNENVPASLITELAANAQGEGVFMNEYEKAAQGTAQATVAETPTFANFKTMVTAIRTAKTSADTYAAMKTRYLDVLTPVVESTNVYTTDAYNTVYGKYLNGTATDEEAAAASIVTTKNSSTYDNLLMPSWKVGEETAPVANVFYINTWSVEGNTDGSNFKTPFFEYWTGDDNVLGAKTFTATQTGLLANTAYQVSAWVRVRQTNAQTKVDNSIQLQVGSGEAVDVTAGDQVGSSQFYLKEYIAVGSTDADGKLTITFTVAGGSNISWLSFKNVKYMKAPVMSVKANKYGTFIAPFDVAIPEGISAYTVTGVNAETSNVVMEPVETTIPANTPVVLKNNTDTPISQTFTGADGSNGETSYTVVLLTGVYTAATIAASDDENVRYVLQTQEAGQAFYKVESAFTATANRCYLTVAVAEAGVKAFGFEFDETGLTSVPSPVSEGSDYYDLQGRRVAKPTKGLYIINGKKVLIK